MPRVNLGNGGRKAAALQKEQEERKQLEDLLRGEIGKQRTSVAGVAARTDFSAVTLHRRLKDLGRLNLKELRQIRLALGISKDQMLEVLVSWL